MIEFIVVFTIGFFVSIVSGILGLGGAVILIPAYLYFPSLFGIKELEIKTISGLTSIQVFASSVLGVLVHKKKGSVDNSLLLTIGIPMTFAAFAGALVSDLIDGKFIILIFACMAVIGSILMFVNKKTADAELTYDNNEFNKKLALIIALFVGLFGGIVGAPGAFLLAPLMISVLKIPVRITIGSTLGIVLLTSFSASLGKIIAGQVNYLLTLYAVLGSIAGVYIGSNLSYKFKPKFLRISLAVLIIGIAVEMLYKFFS